jgi:hypothetical protein
MKKLALHWWILIAMGVGIVYGAIAAQAGASDHVVSWIKPFGTLFRNLLKMIAVPLVLFSLVAGVASLGDMSKVRRIGTKTILLDEGSGLVAAGRQRSARLHAVPLGRRDDRRRDRHDRQRPRLRVRRRNRPTRT